MIDTQKVERRWKWKVYVIRGVELHYIILSCYNRVGKAHLSPS